MGAIRRLAVEAVRSGELPRDPLVRFPQIIGPPVVLTLLWTRLFEKFAPLEYRQMTRACLDLIFPRPLQEGPPGLGPTGKTGQ